MNAKTLAAPMVWSISKWRDWQSCPAMFHAKHVSKQWKDFPSPQMERGRTIHARLEEGVKYDIPLETGDEPALAPFEDVRAAFVAMRNAGVTVRPEYKIGISRGFELVDFFRGADLRVRLAYDVYVNDGSKVLVVDYKTGKYKPEHQEDAVFYGAAAQCLSNLPTTVQYYYVDFPEMSFSTAVVGGKKLLSHWWQRFDAADRNHAADSEPNQVPGPQCKWCGALACPKNRNPNMGNA